MTSNHNGKEHVNDYSQAQNMCLISSALAVFQKSSHGFSDPLLTGMTSAVRVYIRLMFLRIGEIDTLNEKYQAQASIESRWCVELDKHLVNLSQNEQQRLIDGKSVSLINYAQSHWHPQLYIENALGDLKEQIRYSAKKSKDDQQIYICEHRDIKGLFWEKLELQHFPSDVQDLTISIASMLYNDKVILFADPNLSSRVNREAFIDQQEWFLYEHVDTQQRRITEFLFRGDEDDDDNSSCDQERSRSILSVTCHAARRSNYFYWNGYCLILLITLVSFCIFAIPPHLSANRLQISCTLLLTSITFRWTVNRSLPTISYLTTMDRYAIMCLFILVILSMWHAFIGGLIFMWTVDFRVGPTSWLAQLDRYVFFIAISVFAVVHLILFLWLHLVPLKYQRQLKQKDVDYRRSLAKKKSRQYSQHTPLFLHT